MLERLATHARRRIAAHARRRPAATAVADPPVAAVAALALAVLLAACAGPGAPSPSPSPSPGEPLSVAALKYRLIDELGQPRYCDPDEYPVGRGDEAELARERMPEIEADRETFQVVLDRLSLDGASFTIDEVVAIYREWKRLRAIVLEPVDGERYRFDLVFGVPGEPTGTRIAGEIDRFGSIEVLSRTPEAVVECPICLARGTRIATPDGDVAVEELRPGMAVWTLDAEGRLVAGTVVRVGETPVPSTHRVVRLVLADGRHLEASPGHPLPDGRHLGDLRAGDPVDGSTVASAALVRYAGRATFDLLPSGPTSLYWADGILVGSTLR